MDMDYIVWRYTFELAPECNSGGLRLNSADKRALWQSTLFGPLSACCASPNEAIILLTRKTSVHLIDFHVHSLRGLAGRWLPFSPHMSSACPPLDHPLSQIQLFSSSVAASPSNRRMSLSRVDSLLCSAGYVANSVRYIQKNLPSPPSFLN